MLECLDKHVIRLFTAYRIVKEYIQILEGLINDYEIC